MWDRFRNRIDVRHLAMGTSVGVSLVMLLGKIGAYLLTDSAAIYSDAAESVVHLLATSVAGLSLWYAMRPPDENHPYGHGKIAYFSAAVEGGLIVLAALSVVYTAVEALLTGGRILDPGIGIAILVVLTLINLALGLWLKRVGRAHNAVVLISNGRHVLTDVWTSGGVVVGVALVWATDLQWLDPAVALAVGANIGWTGVKLLYRSYQGLMERADEDDTRRIVEELEGAADEGRITGYHQLRHRRVNDQVFVDVHLLFPSDLTIHRAHGVAHEIEERIRAHFPRDEVHVTSHLEPEDHERAHPEGHEEPEDPLPNTFTRSDSSETRR